MGMRSGVIERQDEQQGQKAMKGLCYELLGLVGRALLAVMEQVVPHPAAAAWLFAIGLKVPACALPPSLVWYWESDEIEPIGAVDLACEFVSAK